jgi:hypothetical protein
MLPPRGRRAMASYCVNFYRVLLSSDGHPFRCLQGQIDVPEVESSTEAAEIASKRFEALHRIPDWKIHADAREIVAKFQ